MNQTISILMKRKSVRVFQKKPIPQKVKDQILSAALRAPTAGNMMLYSIIEVNDVRKKQILSKTCDNQPFIARSSWLLLFLADFQRWYDYFARCEVKGMCTQLRVPFRKPSEADLLLACCDTLVAAQNAVIAAESLGVGSCYIGDIMEHYEEHQRLFSLPPHVFPIALVCLGFPAQSQVRRPVSTRFEREFIVFADQYRRLSSSDFDEMFAQLQRDHFSKRPFMKGALNIGQHFYLRKMASPFSLEMTRSVREALKRWREQ